MNLKELNLSQLSAKAQAGDTEAQFVLGSYYYTGELVPQDLAVAARWFERASLHGHSLAQFNLGYMCSQGQGVPVDLEAARKWYGLAADQGLPVAQNNLAKLYERDGQYEVAAHWYRKAADQGYDSAQAGLAFALSQGRGVAVDQIEAIKYYRLAADQGYAPAQFNLGIMYANGNGVPVDPASAFDWIRSAARGGYCPAQQVLGCFFRDGFGTSADVVEAVKWFLRSALQGDMYSQHTVGLHYLTGDGVDKDLARAFMWFSEAAKQGHPDAAQRLQSSPVDPADGICQLISAAVDGDRDAQRDLSVSLQNGDGIDQDADAALYWCRKAAVAGDPVSQTTYALRLPVGDDPEVERERVRWLSLAAAQGDARAQFLLGCRLISGEGTPVDLESGVTHLLRASLAGVSEARALVQELGPFRQEQWASVIQEVRWPDLVIAVGPPAEGVPDVLDISEGDDDAEGDHASKVAARAMMLLTEDGQLSRLLAAAFELDEKLAIKKVSIGRAWAYGQEGVSLIMSLRDIQVDGIPVHWAPSMEAVKAVTARIGFMWGRVWVNGYYWPDASQFVEDDEI